MEVRGDSTAKESITLGLGGIIAAVCLVYAVCFLMTLGGGLSRSTALTVAALVLALIVQLLLAGVVFAALTEVVLIIQSVLCSTIHKAYLRHLVNS